MLCPLASAKSTKKYIFNIATIKNPELVVFSTNTDNKLLVIF